MKTGFPLILLRSGRHSERVARRVSLIATLIVVCCAPAVHAQRTRAYRPSEQSVTTQLQRNYSRLVGGALAYLGDPYSRRRNFSRAGAARSDASVQARQSRQSRRSTMDRLRSGRPGMDIGSQMGYAGGGSILGGRGGGYGGGGFGGFSQTSPTEGRRRLLPSLYKQDMQEMRSQAMSQGRRLTSPDYLGWVQPGMDAIEPAVAPASSLLAAENVDIAKPAQTLEQLVSNHLDARRRSYESRAREALHDARYQESLRLLNLADAASLDVPAARARIKMLMVYAGIAGGQYAAAVDAVRWLATPDATTGRLANRLVFKSFFEEMGITSVGELYGVQADYTDHNQQIQMYATQAAGSAEGRVLLAMVEWGRGNRSPALFEAQKVASEDPHGMWARLPQLMQLAETSDSSKLAVPAGSPLPGLLGIPATPGASR